MPNKTKGKEIGFLMGLPFMGMGGMNPFNSPFFPSGQQSPFSSLLTQNPTSGQNPGLPLQQPQSQTQAPQSQRGFSLTGLDSMFQNAKKFMGYVDQIRPVAKNLGPMLQMFSGTQANLETSSSQRKRIMQKAVYLKIGKNRKYPKKQ